MATIPARRKLYAALHAAAAKAGLDDDAYRAMLVARTGKASAKELSDAQIRGVLDHLNGGAKPQETRRRDDSPTSRKIRALWLSLYHMGVVRAPGEQALAAFVKTLSGVDDLRFLPAGEAYRVIEALKDMGRRAGVNWSVYATPQEAVLAAQMTALRRGLAGCPERLAAVEQALKAPSEVVEWCTASPKTLNSLVEMLGQYIRTLPPGDRHDHPGS